jgi:hypothetical protein
MTMSDQSYGNGGSYEGYGPNQGYPNQQYPNQGYQQPYEDPYAAQQYTQQWQGQTWETQTQQPVAAPVPAAAETAYLPPQGYAAPAADAPAPDPAPISDDEYGPATVGGNARVTDAQRARAEGWSPIIEPGMQPAALTALLGLLLAGAAAVGTYALLVPLVALQAVTAAGWFRLNGMWPAR